MSNNTQHTAFRTLTQYLLVVASVAILVVMFTYPIIGSDGWIHLNWLQQFGDLFASGNWYPRWMPDSFAGFGSPAFYFYPPLPFWVGGIISAIGVASASLRYQLVAVVFLVASYWSSYAFLKSLSSSTKSAIFGALCYCIFPYRVVDLFLRNALGEHAAFVFIPLVALAIYRIAQAEESRDSMLQTMLISTIGWVGLVLSNIPATIILLYVFIVYLLVLRVWQPKYRKALVAHILGAGLAIVIAAVYLMPLTELRNTILTQIMGGVNLQVSTDHSTGYAILDSLVSQKNNTLYVLLDLCLFFGALILWLRRGNLRQRSDAFLRATTITLLIALVVQIPYLLFPLWKALPLMDALQFTWRWNIWVTMVVAVYVTKALDSFDRNRVLHIALSITMVITAGGLWHVANTSPKNSIGFEPIADAQMDAPEYLPRSVSAKPEAAMKFFAAHTNDREIRVIKGSASIGKIDRKPFATTFDVNQSSESADLVFDHAYFPTWHLKDDRGVEYSVQSDSLGRIIATISEGKREYQLSIVKQNSERVGEWISGFGLIGLFVLAVVTVLSRTREVSLPSPPI